MANAPVEAIHGAVGSQGKYAVSSSALQTFCLKVLGTAREDWTLQEFTRQWRGKVFWTSVASACVCCHINTWPNAVEVIRNGRRGSVDIGDKTELRIQGLEY